MNTVIAFLLHSFRYKIDDSYSTSKWRPIVTFGEGGYRGKVVACWVGWDWMGTGDLFG